MAKEIENLTNAEAITGDYPSGRPIDASPSGGGNGTPVDLDLLGDLIQLGAKLIRDGSVTYNDLPDNTTNDFQLFDALIANIRLTVASETEKGTVERATQAEVDAGSDTTRHLTSSTLNAKTSSETRRGVVEKATQAEVDAGSDTSRHLTAALIAGATNIISNAAMKANSVDSDQYVDGSIDLVHMSPNSVNSDQYVDGSIDAIHLSSTALDGAVKNNGNTASFTQIRTSIIIIGDWDMDSTSSLNVAHGLTGANIRTVNCTIIPDFTDFKHPLDSSDSSGVSEGSLVWDGTNIALSRTTGGKFDNTTYDQTSFNRGWITITYEA